MEELSEKLYNFLSHIPKALYIPIGLGLCGMILLGIGAIQYWHSKNAVATAPVAQEMNVPTVASTPSLVVDVEGAVINPGVYKLERSARLQDALIAAGGLSSNADRNFVARAINLAAKITDGEKVYVPKIGEVSQTALSQNDSPTVLGVATTGLVDINSASEEELDNLPGIGPVTAGKIISNRPYTTAEDLLNKKVVSQSVFAKIKDKITVN